MEGEVKILQITNHFLDRIESTITPLSPPQLHTYSTDRLTNRDQDISRVFFRKREK